MAIQLVKAHAPTAEAGTAKVTTIKPESTIPVGNHIILVFSNNNAEVSIAKISDSAGNSYQVDVPSDSAASGRGRTIISARITTQLTTASTITIETTATAVDRILSLAEFSGLKKTSWFHVGQGNNASSGSPSVKAGVIALDRELIFGACARATAAATFSWTTPKELLKNVNDGTRGQATGYEILTGKEEKELEALGTLSAGAWGISVAAYLPEPDSSQGNFLEVF